MRSRKLVVRTILGVIGLGLVVWAVLAGSLSWQDDVKYALFAGLAVLAAHELMRQRAREERAALEAAALDAAAHNGDANADVDPDRQG